LRTLSGSGADDPDALDRALKKIAEKKQEPADKRRS
jgi:hypothetical protein